MTHRRSLQSLALLALLGAGPAACGDALPDPARIAFTRPLGVEVVVTAPIDPSLDEGSPMTRTQALPFETVQLTPYIADPDGVTDLATLDPVWIACDLAPGVGLFGCISEAFPVDLDDIPACPEPSFDDLAGEDLPETISPCIFSRDPVPSFTVPLATNTLIGGSIEVTMIAGPPGGTSTQDCTDPFLDGESQLPNDCIYSVSRISVGPTERLLLLASQFGLDLGDFGEVPDPDAIPDGDRNPRITRFAVGVTDEDGEPVGELTELSRGDVFQAKFGDTLRIETVSPEEDLQEYLVSVNNGESFEPRTESYFASWFRTYGVLLSDFSDDPESFNEWTLEKGSQDEDERPPGDRATLFYVVRDDRQGVNWFWFDVELTE